MAPKDTGDIRPKISPPLARSCSSISPSPNEMDVDNLMFYSQAPSNDGVDELRDDVELFSTVRDDEIESSIMLLECLSGISEGSLGALNEGREEQLDAVKAVDLYEQISTSERPEMQYFSRYD